MAKDAPPGPKFSYNPPQTPYQSPGLYPGKEHTIDDLAEFDKIKSLVLPQRSLSAVAKVCSGYAILKDTHHMWQSVVYRACIVEYAEYAKAHPWGRTQGSKTL